MQRGLFIALVCTLFLAPLSHAKKHDMTMRGGFGFVFPDANRFLKNPAWMGKHHGLMVETAYEQQQVSFLGTDSTFKHAEGSAVGAMSGWGMGLKGHRYSSDLTDPAASIDSMEVGMGVSMMKGKMSMGLSYDRGIGFSQVGDGTLHGSLMIHASKGTGATFGIGASQSLGLLANTTSVIGGVGYMFKGVNNSFEANFEIPDINVVDVWVASGYFSLGSEYVYLSAGFEYSKFVIGDSQDILGRLGVMLGSYVDFSLTGSKTLGTSNNPTLGATLRLTL